MLTARANISTLHTIRYYDHNCTLYMQIYWRQMNPGIHFTPQRSYEAMLDLISKDTNSVHIFHFIFNP